MGVYFFFFYSLIYLANKLFTFISDSLPAIIIIRRKDNTCQIIVVNYFTNFEMFGWRILKAVCTDSSNIPLFSELKLSMKFICNTNITSVITFNLWCFIYMTVQPNLVLELYCRIRERNGYFHYPHHRFRLLNPCQE